MMIRDKFIAHASLNHNIYAEKIVGYIEFKFENMRLEYQTNYSLSSLYSFDENELQNLMVLSSWLIKQIESKKKKLVMEILNNIPREELVKQGIHILQKNK